jgi:hypothetical protein
MTALNGKLLRALALPGSQELLSFNPFMLDAASKYGDINVLANPALRKELGILPPIGGGSSPLLGVHNASDVIVRTIDGMDTNVLWNEFQTLMQILNGQRAPIVDLLTYTVPNPWELVPQASNANVFEKASEYGVPVAQRAGVTYYQMGFGFDWWDTGLRYTWKYLAEATAEQIRADTEAIGEADSRLVFLEVMKTLFRNTNRLTTIDQKGYNVYAFYNADGTVPPSYKTNTFVGTHTHYLASGAATVVSADLDTITNHLAHHGYTASNGYTLVALVNAQEGDLSSVPSGPPLTAVPRSTTSSRRIGTPAFILPANLITNSDQTVAASGGHLSGHQGDRPVRGPTDPSGRLLPGRLRHRVRHWWSGQHPEPDRHSGARAGTDSARTAAGQGAGPGLPAPGRVLPARVRHRYSAARSAASS